MAEETNPQTNSSASAQQASQPAAPAATPASPQPQPSAPAAATPAVPAVPAAAAPVAPAAPQPAAAPAAAPQPATESLDNKPVRISITLPTNAYFLSGIRDFTLGLIRNMTEFSEQWAFRFQSVVDELCNNAIEHGSAPGEDITITFLNVPHESIEIIVQDSGTGKVKLSAKELQSILDQRTQPGYVHVGIRGRGLSKIVFEWTDELEFTDLPNGGIQARIKKYLKDPKLKEMENTLENPTHLVLQ